MHVTLNLSIIYIGSAFVARAFCDVIMMMWFATTTYTLQVSVSAHAGYHMPESMHSASTVVGKVIHYVYTWIPKTAKNDTKEPEKDTRKRKRRVNFSQSEKDQSEITSRMHESFKSSNQLPSTPDGYNVCLHFQRSKAYKEDGVFSPQNFPGCHLEVVGYKFLSSEKKISKRSALKKWLRQRTNVVHNENFHLDEQSHGTRHELCFREVFECSPRLAGIIKERI